MDWDAEFEAGTLLNDVNNNASSRFSTRAPNRSSTSTSTRGASTLVDDDRDVSMAAPSDPAALQDIMNPHRSEETHLEKLMRHWMNERHAPEILEAQEGILSSLLDHIRRQSEAVQLLRGEMSTSEEEHLRIMLVQTEVERVKFVVRSYVRTRLYKIEKYARHIVSNAEVQRRLTASELDHARRFANLTDQHFYHSVLQSLPESQSKLDDTPIFVPSLINEPDQRRPVFVHALDDCPPIRFDDGTSLQMNKGHISLMPYSAAKELLSREQVQLV
ncbi:GINS complex subunit [Marasmius sp. AFHP31]|nr:GINS complex subunit [Marasmius sp. AFHP31]